MTESVSLQKLNNPTLLLNLSVGDDEMIVMKTLHIVYQRFLKVEHPKYVETNEIWC